MPPEVVAMAVAFQVPLLIVPPKIPRPLIVPVVVRLPLLATVKIDLPAALAVNKSPLPELSTTKAAKLVLPEIEATPSVPAPASPLVNLNLADEEAELPKRKSAVVFTG